MIYIYSLFLILISQTAIAGSCCGGGGPSTQIMLGETKAVFRSNFINQSILADSTSQSKINPRDDGQLETIQTLANSLSYRLNSLWQFGLSIPIIEKTKQVNNKWESLQGMGDISLNAAYEVYPEYSRNQFISQAFTFFQITLPTAPSLYTSKRIDLLDSRGQGHTLLTAGTLLRKKWGIQDITFQFALTYREGKKFKHSSLTNQSIQTQESWDQAFTLADSFSINSNISLVTSLTHLLMQNKSTSTFIGQDQSSSVTTTSIGIIYSAEDWDYNLTYSDDLLIGPSQNHILTKSISLGLIRRYSL